MVDIDVGVVGIAGGVARFAGCLDAGAGGKEDPLEAVFVHSRPAAAPVVRSGGVAEAKNFPAASALI